MNGLKTNGSRITPLAVASGAIASFDAQVAAPLKILKADINPVQAGSGDPYPPGGGINKLLMSDTDVSADVDGVVGNWDSDTEVLTISGTNTNTAAHGLLNIMTFVAPEFSVGESYVFSSDIPAGMYSQMTYKSSETQGWKSLGVIYGDGTLKSVSITIPSDYTSDRRLQVSILGTATTLSATCHFELVTGTTAPTEWTPYSNIRPISGWDSVKVSAAGDTTTINLPHTVYDGKLDMLLGVGIENMGKIVFDGSEDENWINYGAENGFYISIPNMKSGTFLNGISNWLKTITATANFGIRFGRSNTTVYCCHITDNISGVTDLASWRTYLASHNLEVIFPLATPAKLTTDPISMDSVAGSNKITTDSGNTTACYLKGVTS